ncbi:hypothetical protein K458DRAFT_397616 [Lentithecium fluviatile CBS 122367]|uniref:Uncharacterized protein n=1 Tax=Lentithecium fluviatile CBS 122367 TaxID=1168545 RepID=A0A6G1ICT8_9PLEO|nr:hypothetical protein K458DRAFT_397616 [Lentithecium fluviatile CBS 122367]
MQHISSSDDASLCKRTLALIAIVYRPVTLNELTYLCEPLKDIANDLDSVRRIVGLCGSFLTIQSGTVSFVHQSAKDFLCTKTVSDVFPSGKKEVHRAVFLRSLQVMSKTLQQDMYSLGALGYPADQVKEPDPDPLAASRYSCIYWIDHLSDWNHGCSAHDRVPLQDQGPVNNFLRTKYLYWLEALSLCKSMPKGVIAMAKLKTLMKGRANATKLSELPAIEDKWSACLQTLEGHSDSVTSVAFSHDSTRLASASYDNTVKIWDASSGECLSTLQGHSNAVTSVAFSHDSTRLASASYDNTVKIWDARSGECLSTLQGHSDWVTSVAFSHDSTRLASASYDNTVKIWDASSGKCLQTFSIGKPLHHIAFDVTGLYLHTNIGTINIRALSGSPSLPTISEPRIPQYQGLSLSADSFSSVKEYNWHWGWNWKGMDLVPKVRRLMVCFSHDIGLLYPAYDGENRLVKEASPIIEGLDICSLAKKNWIGKLFGSNRAVHCSLLLAITSNLDELSIRVALGEEYDFLKNAFGGMSIEHLGKIPGLSKLRYLRLSTAWPAYDIQVVEASIADITELRISFLQLTLGDLLNGKQPLLKTLAKLPIRRRALKALVYSEDWRLMMSKRYTREHHYWDMAMFLRKLN